MIEIFLTVSLDVIVNPLHQIFSIPNPNSQILSNGLFPKSNDLVHCAPKNYDLFIETTYYLGSNLIYLTSLETTYYFHIIQ